MRYLPIKKVEAGMVLAQDILDGQGVMLLGRHQILNQEQIENLDKMGYPGLYIDDKFSEEIEIAEVIKPSIHSKILDIICLLTVWKRKMSANRNGRFGKLSCRWWTVFWKMKK